MAKEYISVSILPKNWGGGGNKNRKKKKKRATPPKLQFMKNSQMQQNLYPIKEAQ